MTFCSNCGAELNDGVQGCPRCSVAGPSPVASPVAVVAPVSAESGLSPTAAGALAYLAGLVTGIIFLVIDPYKKDSFVRFHAFQSVLFNIAWIGLWIVWIVVGIVLSAITKGLFFFIQIPIDLLIMVGGVGLWIFLMYSASRGRRTKLPIIGALAAKQAEL